VTIFACTWVALHPNIPDPTEDWFPVARRRIGLTLMALIGPEVVVLWALRQRFAARRWVMEYKKNNSAFTVLYTCEITDVSLLEPGEWTKAHAFFAIMGGFMFFDGDKPNRIIEPEELCSPDFQVPHITEVEIIDRSKADLLSKALAMTQTGWFMLQCIARRLDQLPITELELVTVAFATLNLATYVCWWDKPLNVQRPFRVQKPSSEPESDSKVPDSGPYHPFVTPPVVKDIISSENVVDRPTHYERRLGDSELSYFLPSRSSGVNDMYLHLGFRAAVQFVKRERVRTVWALLRVRHPLLGSKVVMRDYNDVSFVYTPPRSPEDAITQADENLEYNSATKDELIDSYLNGPRTLSNDRLSYLIVSTPEAPDTPSPNHEFFICAAHFLGDGMALHQFANDFFTLLGSSKTIDELETLLRDEYKTRLGQALDEASVLPSNLETKFPAEGGRFYRAAAQIDFKNSQDKLIGGHAFPRRSGNTVHTIVPTVPFDTQRTKAILKNCKAHGVSVSAALFAICSIAWTRLTPDKPELPLMMYSALNLRPYFTVRPTDESYWFLAIGYFNVILSNFIPKSIDVASTFWRRAQLAKEQSTRAAKNSMVVSRSRLMARERGQRSRAWAKEDDDKERGTWVAPQAAPSSEPKPYRAPSSALIGLSLLGNLDGMYKHANFPEIQLHTLTTGSRQRQGAMLLFGYTFAGKLWVSLGYDENGFDKEFVQKFWDNCLSAIDEFL